METEVPFGSPRKKPLFFEPIHKTLEKKIRKVKKTGFFFLRIIKDNIKGFLKILNEKIRWIIKIVLFIKRKVKKLFSLVTRVYDPSQNEEPKLRIISRFNYRNKNLVNKNPVFCNRAKTNAQGFEKFVNRDKHFDTDTNNSLKWKVFLWPTHRLEDLACMNRYWFDTNNGSRFSMSRIHMYKQFGIR
ncbi:hypothetical protein EJ110_NYTH03368 [Nymphaea thermarum]|nr:hypothetical protein EJ110_NYTH03368 [Nymphaea thermarum]